MVPTLGNGVFQRRELFSLWKSTTSNLFFNCTFICPFERSFFNKDLVESGAHCRWVFSVWMRVAGLVPRQALFLVKGRSRKVTNHGVEILAEEDIIARNIAVEDAFRVKKSDGIGHLLCPEKLD